MPRHPVRNLPEGHRWCPMCETAKPLSAFTLNASNAKGHDGYCKPCKVERQRQRRVKMAGLEDPTLAARFWKNVEVRGPNECWPWTAGLRSGYGVISAHGRTIGAHRISLMFAGWTLPESRFHAVVDHICRNRRCVNPAHMRLVPQAVNAVENSSSPFAVNRQKTHCKRAHEFSPKNTRWILAAGRPARMCIECYKLRRPGGKVPVPNRREDVMK